MPKFTEIVKNDIIYPPSLPQGGRIGIFAPSSQININGLSNGYRFLKKCGYDVVMGRTIQQMMDTDFMNAPDRERANELMEFFDDDSIDMIIAAAGGYGTTRILKMLDYDLIARKPKIVVGLSDTCGLLMAILTKSGLASFMGQTAEISASEESKWNMVNMLHRVSDPTSSIILPEGYSLLRRIGEPKTASGMLVASNLNLLTSLAGTEFFPKMEGSILAIEDVSEAIFKIESMLQHLELCNVFDDISGVLLGEFTMLMSEFGNGKDERDAEPSVNEIFISRFKNRKYPIMTGVPFSHGKYNVCLPIGRTVKIDTGNMAIKIL